MQVVAIVEIVAVFALACSAIYVGGRALQRRGHDLTFVDPRYPGSMQAVPGDLTVAPPRRPHRADDTSLFRDNEQDSSA